MNSLAIDQRNGQRVTIDSPIGPLTLYAENDRLLEVRFGPRPDSDAGSSPSHGELLPILRQTEREIGEYFDGLRREFSVSLTLRGTPFQNQVWRGLSAISFGETCSYSHLACRVGSPRSARAVGVALGRNPIAIIVPCHRVVGADGSLVGFGGGLEIKRRLLEHEARLR
jgi:methylated-DNA-[protein]-cysteine S-methyltransferase